MVQPIQYLNAPVSPFTRLAEGLVIGQQIGQIQQQNLAAQQAQQLKEQYSADVQRAFDLGTPSAFAELTAKYPQQREAFKQSFELLSSDQQNNEFMAGAQAFNAIKSGNIDAAKQLLQTRIEAARNAGQDTSKLEAMLTGLDVNPDFVANTLGMTLSALDADRWSKMATEFRASVAEPFNLKKLEAEANKLTKEAEGVGGIDNEKLITIAKDLRKEYSDQTKTFKEVQDAFDRINSAEETAAGDLALIFSYMKMLDPGSVVREGEFATAQNAAGVPQRVLNIYNNILSGERLNPGQRKSFISQAKSLFEPIKNKEQEVRQGIKRIGNKLGIKDEDLFYSVEIEEQETDSANIPNNLKDRPYAVFGK